MTKQLYLKALMTQPIAWIEASAANPTIGMTKMHIRLHHLAIRKLSYGSRFVDVGTITEYGLTQKLSNAVRVF